MRLVRIPNMKLQMGTGAASHKSLEAVQAKN